MFKNVMVKFKSGFVISIIGTTKNEKQKVLIDTIFVCVCINRM